MSEKEMFIPKPLFVSQLHFISQTSLLIIASIFLFLCSCIFIYVIIIIHHRNRKNRRASSSTLDCGFKNGGHHFTRIENQTDLEVPTNTSDEVTLREMVYNNNSSSPSRSPGPLRKKSPKLESVYSEPGNNSRGLHSSSKDLVNSGGKGSSVGRPTRNSTGNIRHKPPPPRRTSSLITTVK